MKCQVSVSHIIKSKRYQAEMDQTVFPELPCYYFIICVIKMARIGEMPLQSFCRIGDWGEIIDAGDPNREIGFGFVSCSCRACVRACEAV